MEYAGSGLRRAVPRSGEMLPVMGLGTYATFDVGTSERERAPRRDVLRRFADEGGVIDSSPMYGEAECVVGDLAQELGVQARLFLATKVWISGRDDGIRSMERSLRLLRTERVDLMQIHNLLDWRTHLKTLREWKAKGRIRYIGATHYTVSAYNELARVVREEDIDFVQLNYSLAERDAENYLLPLAAERRVAVVVNRPLAEGELFRRVRQRALPDWAQEIGCRSWSQFFLKYVISHEAVTCVIPATRNVAHLADNLQAVTGTLPDPALRRQMARFVSEL
jgi:aryl-alcohol dehydrogenase-like predicted oxidoreductase